MSFALIAQALAMEIHDPKALIAQLDQLNARVPFSDAFRCGDTAKLRNFHKNCKFGCDANFGCMAICEAAADEFARTVAECTPESVSLVDTDGTSNEVTSADYQKASGNLLRAELGALDVFIGLPGYAELDDLKPVQFALPSGKAVDALELTGRYVTPKGSLEFLYDVAKEAPGVAQVLYKRVGNQKIFKVREFARKAP